MVDPNPRGQIRHSTGPLYSHDPRKLPIHAVISDCVFERMRDALPVYAPESLFKLNEELDKKRHEIDKEVTRLADTNSIETDECDRIRKWSNEKLSLMKWGKYLELEVDGGRLKDKLRPEVELSNESPGPPAASGRN